MSRSREEQITALKKFVASICPDQSPSSKTAVSAVAREFIEEAEQRARAEHVEDAARLMQFAGTILNLWREDLGDLDGGRVQEELARAGLLVIAQYNHAVHGDIEDVDPGDDCWVLTDFGKSCSATIDAARGVAGRGEVG